MHSFFIIIITITALLIYFFLIRPWQLHWGAAQEEISRSMHGDEIVYKPSFDATRAVTINAPPECIYPWIVQIGMNRAGWYSYDVLDNLGRKSAKSILPEFQKIQIGDLIPMSPDGKHGPWVKEFRANEWILWWDKKGDTSWVWGIYPDGERCSRLVTRVRMKYRWISISAVFNLLIEFCDLPMMRKSMLGIKERAENKFLLEK
jgi:hypothetical protein